MAITSTLGSFLITGNKIHVSDPCYDYSCSGAFTLDNVLPGKYLATLVKHNLDIWDTRVCKLTTRTACVYIRQQLSGGCFLFSLSYTEQGDPAPLAV